MRINRASLIFSLLLSIFCSPAFGGSTTPPKALISQEAGMGMPLVAPLFLEDGEFDGTLILVNDGSVHTYADVTLRDLDGNTVATTRVQFEPHSQEQINIRTLLDRSRAPGITAGSIIVMQSPDLSGMVITAALSMTRMGIAGPQFIDQELAMPSMLGSNKLQAVTDESDGPPLVAITSLSENSQRIRIHCLSEIGSPFIKNIELLPNETLLTSGCSERTVHGSDIQDFNHNFNPKSKRTYGITVSSDAMPGSFAAFGLAPHSDRDAIRFSSVNFFDPKMIMSTTSVFTGVPVGQTPWLGSARYLPVLSLANFSEKAVHVVVHYSVTEEDNPASHDIRKITVAARSTLTLPLEGLEGNRQLQNSFLVESDGVPGDIATKLIARDPQDPSEVEILDKDLHDPLNGGNYPWSIAQGTNSTLLLFNTSDTAQYFTVAISSEGTNWQKSYYLQPLATKAINIRQLMEDQVKDDKGHTLRKDIWMGQLDWFIPGPFKGRGRLLQSNNTTGMARNFSCGVNITLCGANFDAQIIYLLDGQQVTFGDIEPLVCQNSCSGTPVGYGNNGFSYNWSSGNTNIVSIPGSSSSQSVDVYGENIGAAPMYGSVSDEFGCYASVSPPPATVQPHILFGGSDITNGSSNVVIGQQIPLQASFTLPSGVSISSQSWSVPGTTIGGYTASVSGGQTTATILSGQSATYYWVDIGSSRQVTYTVHLSNGQTASAITTFNVQGPTSVSVTTPVGTINIANNNKMVFGGSLSNTGITFNASATNSSGVTGAYSWVQIVTSSTYTTTPISGSATTCSYAVGLDSTYPYDTGTQVDDNPSISLASTNSEVTDADSFKMYLMWNPTLTSSIPVPLGYVTWGWSGVAVQNTSTHIWSLSSSNIAPHTFSLSTSFPTWTITDNSTGGGLTCN